MNWSDGGDFTRNLVSLRLQLNTLLEDVGGDEAAGLMDALTKLTPSEKKVLIPSLTNVVNKLVENENRLASKNDVELKEFEESLYESVMDAVQTEANKADFAESKKLSVVDGGKVTVTKKNTRPVKISTLIDLAKARDERRGMRK